MSALGDKKDLIIGRTGFSLDTVKSGKRGFCYFDGKRYDVLAGTDIRKWAEVLVITLTPEPTVIETYATAPLSYQLATGSLQAVSQETPLPVVSSVDEAAIRKAILEANLGSRDPTGIPIFQDGFDYPLTSWDGAAAVNGALGWDPNGAGTIARNTAYKFRGVGCLGITTPAVANAVQRAWKVIPRPKSGRIAVECYMAGQTDTENFGYFNLGFRYRSLKHGNYDGYFLSIGSDVGGVCYVSPAGAYVPMTEFGPTVDAAALGTNVIWHYCKLVVDLDKRQYVRVIWDGIEKDLSALAIGPGNMGAPILYDTLIVQLAAVNAPAAVACLTLYDEVLVTSDES